jgi:hypothetical protein
MGSKWIGLVVGVVVGAGLAIGAVVALSRSGGDEPKVATRKETASKSQALNLDAGTPVELLLLKPLHSGDAEVGEEAELIVTKDVKDSSGNVCVPIGARATLEVVRSREGSVATSLVNQPARLEVRFLSIKVDGKEVPLCANQDDPMDTMELTRDTASRSEASAALKELWEHAETQEFLSQLSDRMNGEGGEDFDDPDSRRIMKDVAQQLGMKAMAKVGADGESVGSLIDTARRARTISVTEVGLALQAITELGRVAGGVDRGLRGTIKGRNIKVPIGTRLTAYVARDTKIAR